MAFNSNWSGDEQELPPVGGGSRWLAAGSATIGLLILVLATGWWFSSDGLPAVPAMAGPVNRPIAVAADGYIGSHHCRECHRHEHGTWHDSFHRTMTQVASTQSVVGKFEGVELERAGRRYRLGRDADDFWVEVPAPESTRDARPAASVRRKVALCTGSHHMQVYWLSTGRGREVEDLPFVWLIADQKWVPRDSSFLLSPSAPAVTDPGLWNRSCITCHTTHGDRKLESPELPQSTVAEFGIACEACHGPGESHVRYHNTTTKSLDHDPIVNPARLPHERSAEVCGRCHMAWHQQVARSDLDYRPGDDLRSLRRTEMTPAQFWRDGMVRVVGREFNGLASSPCFQRGKLTCVSCHQLHQSRDDTRPRADWTDDQLKPEMRGNQACLSCHEAFRSPDKLADHTHHMPLSEGSRCYNCHMPNSTYGILKATRSHQITSPSLAETVVAGRPNACNLCHLDKTLKWTDEKLVDWYGQAPTKLPGDWSENAAAVDWALAGDAGQRALVAWHLGWEPVRQASGADWLTPYLAILMADDYPAVRFIAHRSLRQLGRFSDIAYDSEMPHAERQRVSREITNRWQQESRLIDQPRLLISKTGELEMDKLSKILEKRDHTPISLEE